MYTSHQDPTILTTFIASLRMKFLSNFPFVKPIELPLHASEYLLLSAM